MFIGHYAVALAAKKIAPRTSLGTLFLAAVFVDLLWPTFLLLGWERVRIDPVIAGVTPLAFLHYPWTHSLLMVAVWAMLLGVVMLALTRDGRGAIVVAALVLSHWVLDVVVHRPDLPLVPGGHLALGLGLWNSPAATLLVELGLFAGCAFVCLRAVPRLNRWPLWSLLAFLVAVYFANLFGPPPPSIAAIAWAGQLQWLIVLAAYWIDRGSSQRGGHDGGADRSAPGAAPV